MSKTAETVGDVLGHRNDDPHVDRLLETELEVRDPETLTYEDWVRPMKLTGGRVCLEVEWSGYTWYYARQGDGHLYVLFEARHGDDPLPVTPGDLAEEVRAPETDVRPVLREETPFAEVDDDG